MKAIDVQSELKKLGDTKRAQVSSYFFKTGKGQYGEGDKFLGIIVPEQRKVAKKYKDLELPEVKKLLNSKIHEERFVALEILVFKYEDGKDKEKEKVVKFYLQNTKQINNWDLVDTSAPYILGDFLLNRDKSVLYKLAKSKNIWDRRIAIVSTLGFINKGQFKETVKISEMLLKDSHDLIHKSSGWMLREMGKKSLTDLEKFLNKYAKVMPRTMLRYAIEKFPVEKRKEYMKK